MVLVGLKIGEGGTRSPSRIKKMGEGKELLGYGSVRKKQNFTRGIRATLAR